MILKVLHNANCSKSNAALSYLKDKGVDYEVINIVENPLTATEIKTILKKMNVGVDAIVRKADKLYHTYAEKNLSEEEWIEVLSKNPSLVQRPILVLGKRAILGRPLEQIESFLLEKL